MGANVLALGAPTITLRPYAPKDREAILRLHEAHGAGYWFADPDDPINPITLVAEAGDGKLIGAVTGRLCMEAFLMLDPNAGSPAFRWELVQKLMEEGGRLAHQGGIREVHIATPLKSFAKRLLKLPAMWPERRWRLIYSLFHRFKENP